MIPLSFGPWLGAPWVAALLALGGAPLAPGVAPAVPETHEDVTVTAARVPRKGADSPRSISVVDRARLDASAAPVLDETLRQVPGFSLFRRTDSRFSNPTAQGVSLRGSGASGASRALVLADLVPQNDPFGGWVHWGRVPRLGIERVELLRGGASDLYGSAALGGVVQVVRRVPDRPLADVELSAGELGTREAAFFAGAPFGRWTATLGADRGVTDGFVPAANPGVIDRPLDSRRTALELSLARSFEGGARAFLSGSHYEDDRGNGTELQRNAARIDGLAAGLDLPLGAGSLVVRAWHDQVDYDQTFSSIAPDRSTETLNRTQHVPAHATGLASQVSWTFSKRTVVVGGIDAVEVQGDTDETVPGSSATAHSVAGGRQRDGGIFATVFYRASDGLQLEAGARADAWSNLDARKEVGPAGAPPSSTTVYADRSGTAVSPRLALVVAPDATCSGAFSIYGAFRAPTLNELYRSFRVGNVFTAANPALDPETLGAAEAGLRCGNSGGTARGRVTLFWSEVADPVSNVTLGTVGGVIQRERQNLGRNRSRGIEAEAETRLGREWSGYAGLQLVEPTVESAPGQPLVEGRDIPQVPRRVITAGLRWDGSGGTTVSVDFRNLGPQYDDDRNLYEMGGFGLVGLYAGQRVGRGVTLFAAIENLFDHRYETALTPSASLGMPRLARAGLRFSL